MHTTIVIGGGPAGMMAAGTISNNNNEVILIEKNNKLGKKLYITGKGRCNYTNYCEMEQLFDNVITNSNFLYSSFYTFSNYDTIDFFNNLGVKEKIERGGRVFPESDKSSDIIKALEKYIKLNNVKIKLNTKVVKINTKDKVINEVVLDDGTSISCNSVIIATGGLSYPTTGSTGDGYLLAKELGHNIIKPFGGLVPLETIEDYYKSLQGLTLKNVNVSLYENKKLVVSKFGEMLFTHFGISGPVILSLSSYMKNYNNKYSVAINLKPALDNKKLNDRLLRDFSKYQNKSLKNAMVDLLPKKLISIIIEVSGLDGDKKINQISKIERINLIENMHNFKMNIKRKRNIDEAIITSGGINTKEINPSTMESKLIKNLFFAGEIIDVDALTGGYNLQIAFSTGYLSGKNSM